MSDKKNIDNLFRETFNDFEASPDPAIWDKISDRLDAQASEKKRERIVFLPWIYKGLGIAAALLLLFFVGNEFVNTNENGVNSEQQTTSTTKKDANPNENKNGTSPNFQLTNTNSEENSSNNTNNSTTDQLLKDKERLANKNTVDNTNIQQKNGNDENAQQGNALQNAVAQQNETNATTTSQEASNNGTNANNTKNRNLITNENAVVTNNSSQNKNSNKNTKNQETQTNRLNNVNYNVKNEVSGEDEVAQQTKNGTKNSANDIQNGVNSSTTNTNKVANSNTSGVAQNDKNNSENTSNSLKTDAIKAVDTLETTVAEVKKDDEIKKSLLDVINDLHDLEKDTEVAEAKRKKWTISPNASPVYYNSITNGSPIDEAFADNAKVGEVNLSYGINVGYDVSKRLTVRSGIHKVDYSYNTQDIALVPSINGNALSTIAFRNNGAAFEIKDRGAPADILYSLYQLPTTESSIFEKQIEGKLNQRMSYIEVPVELKYAVLDKKLGINVIGGVSTLLLTENSISVDSPELFAELGEATNINDVSFSTNIGLGIDYKISEKLEFNVEPMLKYQLNTFSGNTGNFKPYSVGVYTGVSFKF